MSKNQRTHTYRLIKAKSTPKNFILGSSHLTDEEMEIRGGTYKAQVSQSGTVQAVREPRHPALPGPGLTGEAPSWRNAWEFAEPSGALLPFSAEGF